ncbi:hypothetical protein G6F56_011413 [Rhizopus delemar]|nr:hypothetical protein G6F56_011413 [Rhizopus delemar]
MAQDFVRSTFNLVDICSLLPQHESFDFQPRMEEQKSFDNFTFTNHNIVKNKRLPFESDHFDYVQQNLTALTYKYEDWPFILEEMSRVTKPGGYIQLIELDLIPHHLGPQGELWLDQVRQGLKENRNLEPKITLELEQLLKNIGLVDVQSKFVSVPLGSWGLDIGSLWKENYDLFFSSAKPYLTEILNISSRDYKKHVHAFMEELDEYRPFSNIHLVWGRIPKTS